MQRGPCAVCATLDPSLFILYWFDLTFEWGESKKNVLQSPIRDGSVARTRRDAELDFIYDIFVPALTDDVPTSHQAGWQARGPGEDVSYAS